MNKILIGNKCDIERGSNGVTTEEGQALAKELGIPFMEVSAKSNINIEQAFTSLASDIKKRLLDSGVQPQGQQQQQNAGVTVGGEQKTGAAGGCC